MTESYFEVIKQHSMPFVLWQLYFPKVFKENGGLDIVIGNPPYVDSECMSKIMPLQRELYSKLFTCTRGNWDLYIPFLEKGFNLLNKYGTMSLITPNKWIAIKYGSEIRKYLFPYIFNVNDYSNFYAFESADVSTVVVIAQKVKTDKIKTIKFNKNFEKTTENFVNKNLIVEFDNISLCLSNNFRTLQKILQNNKLNEYFDISGAATVAETYEIANFVKENNSENIDESKYFKFINTGTIDKFTSLWGKEEMTYVKKKYIYPVVDKTSLREKFPKRFKQAQTSKLITTGIRYFEVYGDFIGEYLAAKSTEIITSKDIFWTIKALLPILNSSVVFFFLKEAYGGMAMGGGITFSPDNLSKIPIPNINEKSKENLEKYAEIYSSLEFDSKKQDELDQYIYEIYNLDENDINILENFKRKNKTKKIGTI